MQLLDDVLGEDLSRSGGGCEPFRFDGGSSRLVEFRKILSERYGYGSFGYVGPAPFGLSDKSFALLSSPRSEAVSEIRVLVDFSPGGSELDALSGALAQLPPGSVGVGVGEQETVFLKHLADGRVIEVFDLPSAEVQVGAHPARAVKSPSELGRTFISIHNHIYANDGLSAQEAFGEVLKLLFAKVLDEQGGQARFSVSDEEYEDCLNNGGVGFRKRLDRLFGECVTSNGDLFDPDDKLQLRTPSLAYAVGKLQGYCLSDADADVKGLAFQKFLVSSQRGDRGQYFTPEPVVDLMIEILRPTSGEVVLDPACGTGGFLSKARAAIAHDGPSCAGGEKVIGLDISRTLARVARMRAILEGAPISTIMLADSLSPWENLSTQAFSLAPQSVDVILTNPPFGTQGKVTSRGLLGHYRLGHKWTCGRGGEWAQSGELLRGQVPDLLFIERCLDLLRPGGRMAIVLPDGDLENPSLGYVRSFIRHRADVLASISLPQKTFVPHGTAVQASVLVLRKKLQDSNDLGGKVFFSVIENIGYVGNKLGSPVYVHNDHGAVVIGVDGEPLVLQDISDVASRFAAGPDGGPETSLGFWAHVERASDRLDPEFYLPEYAELEAELDALGAVELGSIASIVSTRAEALRQPSAIIDYVELSSVSSEYSEIVRTERMPVHDAPSRASYELREGDIITAIAGNSTGTRSHATAYVTAEHAGCVCSNGFRVLRAFGVSPLYLLYYLRTDYFLRQMKRLRTGAAIPVVSDSDLRKVRIVIPSQDVQNRVVERVDVSMRLRREAASLLRNITLT